MEYPVTDWQFVECTCSARKVFDSFCTEVRSHKKPYEKSVVEARVPFALYGCYKMLLLRVLS